MGNKELLKGRVKEILSGIDSCYQIEGGWWRTPYRASFGQDKLREVIHAIENIDYDSLRGEGWRSTPVQCNDTLIMGSTTMGDSSLNATEIAVGSLLAGGRGMGYGGGGAWGGGGGYYDGNAFANPSANGVRIDRNGVESEMLSDSVKDVARDGIALHSAMLDTAERSRQFSHSCDRTADGFNNVSEQAFRSELRTSDKLAGNLDFMYHSDQRNADQRFQTELRTNDRLLALQAEINENARKAADCCCDLKLQACEDKSQVLAAIAASEGRGIERALNAAQAKITQLETINALSKCFCPPPCPER